MAAINATPETITGAPAQQHVWSAGDYDRLASYGSAPEAAHLVRVAGVQPGDRVLDVGTGSGLVAILAAQREARVAGVDPTPELLEKAKDNAALAGFSSVHVDSLTMTFECDSALDYCRIFKDYGWKSRIDALPSDENARFHQAVADATRPYVDGGPLRLAATSLCASAQKR